MGFVSPLSSLPGSPSELAAGRRFQLQRSPRGESTRGRLRDVDSTKRAQLLKIFTWSLMGGVVGGLMGVLGVVMNGWGPELVPLMALIGWTISFAFPLVLSSLAESLTARGMYDEAIAAFQAAIAGDASDPTPYLMIARVYRDRLGSFEEAALWFRRALDESTLAAGTATPTRRELVELYVKMGEPARAAPLLARTAEQRAGTAEGERAARELVRVKATIAGEAEAQ